MSGTATPPTYLHDYLEYTQDIWHGFSKNIKVDFFGSEISSTPPPPPETPLWSEISASETKNDPKILREILYKLYLKSKISSKKYPHGFREDFLGPKVTTLPPNLGVGRNFYGSGRIFENFELWVFLKKIFWSLFTAVFFDFFPKIVKK